MCIRDRHKPSDMRRVLVCCLSQKSPTKHTMACWTVVKTLQQKLPFPVLIFSSNAGSNPSIGCISPTMSFEQIRSKNSTKIKSTSNNKNESTSRCRQVWNQGKRHRKQRAFGKKTAKIEDLSENNQGEPRWCFQKKKEQE